MKPQALWAEATANLLSGTTRAALLALVFAAIVGGLTLLDARTVIDVVDSAEQFRRSGASTQVMRAPGQIDGRQCDALSSTLPITAVGALRPGGTLRFLAMPDTAINTWEVTPGVLRLLPEITNATFLGSENGASDTTTGQIWLSADLAEALGASVGSRIVTSAGETRIGGIYDWPSDGRARDLGFTALIPTPPTGLFDSCWADIWPTDEAANALLFLTLSGGGQNIFELGQLNPRLGANVDAARNLETRLTRHVAVATFALGAAIGWAAIRLRRLEIASALHAKTRKSDLLAQHLIEAACYLTLGAVIALGAVMVTTTWTHPGMLQTNAQIALFPIIAGVCGAILATIVAITASREKHLFDLFKSR